MICFASSIKTGLQKPNFLMLFAICPTCLRECVRALFGYGRSSRTAVYSIFIENTFSIAASQLQRMLKAPCSLPGRYDVAEQGPTTKVPSSRC